MKSPRFEGSPFGTVVKFTLVAGSRLDALLSLAYDACYLSETGADVDRQSGALPDTNVASRGSVARNVKYPSRSSGLSSSLPWPATRQNLGDVAVDISPDVIFTLFGGATTAVFLGLAGLVVVWFNQRISPHSQRARKAVDAIEKLKSLEVDDSPRDGDANSDIGAHGVSASNVISGVQVVVSDRSLLSTAQVSTKWIEELFQSYHGQALDQAAVQFWFSILAATAGFSLIVYQVILSTGTAGVSAGDVALRAAPGGVIDAVAALFFKQAAETRQRATELFDRLRTDNQRGEALQIANSIDDSGVRSSIKAQLALHIAGITPSKESSDLILNFMTGGKGVATKNGRSRSIEHPAKSETHSNAVVAGADGSREVLDASKLSRPLSKLKH